ncbi:response regulator transcription factor [Paraclostridium ghonii]|uniref:Stage 0 sporulation protein A homolog n=1 Tax=Paraclostridium ghonii TaxID=29358 RepID=A0ABU0MYE5_9FIRM|nr:response regulator transcription factor [Paeniclostridium ghonii]MDQ0555922.1 DNA-binding response OmpR family regulator [Paeniclostridium ghonii]
MKLLIIEDEEDLVNLLAKGLRSLGYVVDISTDGREGLELFSINDYDLVVLDINLPSMDGRLILDEIRKENEECKVIILSALSDYKQRIEGLDRGANDYLVKPFDFGELVARIRSLLRRNFIQKNVKLKHENIILDTALRCVYSCDNENIKLSPKEFALLEYLITNKGRVVSAEELIEHVWDSDEYMFSNAVKVHISTLRKKLNPYCKNDIILNIRGEGYIINEN